MDYKEAWDKLRAELEDLGSKDVRTIHPLLVLGYMHFIEQAEAQQRPDIPVKERGVYNQMLEGRLRWSVDGIAEGLKRCGFEIEAHDAGDWLLRAGLTDGEAHVSITKADPNRRGCHHDSPMPHDPAKCAICQRLGGWSTTTDSEEWLREHAKVRLDVPRDQPWPMGVRPHNDSNPMQFPGILPPIVPSIIDLKGNQNSPDPHNPATCLICRKLGDWSTTADSEQWIEEHRQARLGAHDSAGCPVCQRLGDWATNLARGEAGEDAMEWLREHEKAGIDVWGEEKQRLTAAQRPKPAEPMAHYPFTCPVCREFGVRPTIDNHLLWLSRHREAGVNVFMRGDAVMECPWDPDTEFKPHLTAFCPVCRKIGTTPALTADRIAWIAKHWLGGYDVFFYYGQPQVREMAGQKKAVQEKVDPALAGVESRFESHDALSCPICRKLGDRPPNIPFGLWVSQHRAVGIDVFVRGGAVLER